ncbi:MAG TPA: substrate-binding domain-containing protein, partial [Solirubrobacteraceae bacterium]|nr:substrate-binding domain-containing protein [Solirubrobacteraceae bacterium]
MKKTQRLSLLAPLAAVLLLAFGVQAQAGAATTSAVVKAAQKRLAADYKGDYGSPPRSGPKPAKGKKIAIVPVTLGAPSIADQANAAKQAATLVGWKTTIFDGKASVSGFNEAIRAATAARVNAIFTIGIDCAPVQSALSEAKKAGIKIVASVGSDCDAAPLKKSKLFDATVGFNFGHVFAVTGRMRADWLIANAGDHAKILQFVQGDNPVIAPQVTATETS